VPDGRFITFEGIEGCGKSTQAKLLAQKLVSRGVPVLITREPGGTDLGERLRGVLMARGEAITPLAELFLMEAARAQHVERVIRPALARGDWVVCDRFADSSTAYQGGGRGLGAALVEEINQIACRGLLPDRTILLDLPVGDGLERARGRVSTNAANCRFEDEDLAFHRAVAAAYRDLAAREPARVAVVDGRGAVEDVHGRVLTAMGGMLP
jgi:dTMP kinase